jgi:plasmid stabilization system protein ParE
MKRLVVSPDAAQDLHDIWEYIAEDNLDAADRFLGKLHDRILALAETPGMILYRATKRPGNSISHLASIHALASR